MPNKKRKLQKAKEAKLENMRKQLVENKQLKKKQKLELKPEKARKRISKRIELRQQNERRNMEMEKQETDEMMINNNKMEALVEQQDDNSVAKVETLPPVNRVPLQDLNQILSPNHSEPLDGHMMPEEPPKKQPDKILHDTEENKMFTQENDKDSDYDTDATVCYSIDDLPTIPGWNSGNSSFHTDHTTHSNDGESGATELYNDSSLESLDTSDRWGWLRHFGKDNTSTTSPVPNNDKNSIKNDSDGSEEWPWSRKFNKVNRSNAPVNKDKLYYSDSDSNIDPMRPSQRIQTYNEKPNSSNETENDEKLNKNDSFLNKCRRFHEFDHDYENCKASDVPLNDNSNSDHNSNVGLNKWSRKIETDEDSCSSDGPDIDDRMNKSNDSDCSDGDMKYGSLFRSILDSYQWNKDSEPEESSESDDCGNNKLENPLNAFFAGPSSVQSSANRGGKNTGRKRTAPRIPPPPRPAKRARRRMDSDGEMYSEDSDSPHDGLLGEINKVMAGVSTNDNKKNSKVKIPNALENEEEEYGVAELYDDYMPLKLKVGRQHPDPVVETATLASVEPVDMTYQLQLPDETIAAGKLSALQLEAVVYSSQAHEHSLPHGERAGFLCGDGAGVGKGRTVAGVIFENWLRGRRKAVWVSISNDLKLDAERDLADIGANDIQVHSLKDYKYVKLSEIDDLSEGVMFLTYTALSSKGRPPAGSEVKFRVDQLIEWCGDDFDGVIVLDECHRAKNLCPPGGKGKPTKTGLNVLKLQETLPKARLVYASATGATEPKNMAYMVRLGLWGKGTAFATFSDFIKVVEKGGVGAMEIVAMDMKLRGMYIARQLSFRGVSFHIEEVPLTDAFRKTYDDSVALWVKAREMFKQAVALYFTVEAEDPMLRKTVWAQFWGTHQRFFKYLCIAVKVERAVELANKAIAEGKCVVIGLQSTGEARTLANLQRAGEMTEFMSTAHGVFKNLVETQMPGTKKRMANTSVAARLRCIQSSLLQDIDKLGKALPPNMLDELIDKLGGPDVVAEMTGRKGRMVKTIEGGRVQVQYQSRCSDEATLETLNVLEKSRFMRGDKLVAVISEAASSGISLQSDRRVANLRRRVHITLELPWSADRAVQQFGRTHRSNQVNAPEYECLISLLAGERRFASVVAKRLESLGALTHGDRRAARTRDLSQFNIDNKYGKEALTAVLHAVRGGYQRVPPPGDPPEFLKLARQALENVGLIEPEEGGYAVTKVLSSTENCSMTKFLNRLLGVPVQLQNTLFQYFLDNLTQVTEEAKRSGTFEQGIVDVPAARGTRTLRVLRDHATGHAHVTLHTVRVDRGMDWESAYRKCEELDGQFYLAKTSCAGRRNILLYVGDHARPQIYRPGTGLQRAEPLSEIERKYDVMRRGGCDPRARELWTRNHEDSRTVCSHAFFRTCQPDCKWGLRERTYFVLAGSVLAVWDKLEFQRMQVARLRCTNAGRIVGILIPASCVDAIEQSLKADAVSVQIKTYDDQPDDK